MRSFARILPLFCALLLLPSLSASAQKPTPDSAIYGAYPENYQEIVNAWLNTSLSDPRSMVVKWLGAPHQGRLDVGKGQKIAGYLVDFTVNARNIFGAYTGPQKHTALVRDGNVVTATGFIYR